MYIAIAGLHIESCTFSPLLTKGDDFSVQRGDDLAQNYKFLASFSDVTFVPLVRARAIPGGPVERSFYENIKEEILYGLSKQKWDGVFLPMHGAVNVDGLDDAEGDLLEAIRNVVGKDCIIAASYDLHGNVSEKVVKNLDILSAYRTAPHVDWYETLERTCNILVNSLRTGQRPYLSYISVPILLPGEQTSTEWEPASSLYSLIPKIIQEKNLIDASILIGYIWADEPRSSASVIAIGTDKKNVRDSAVFLAERVWNSRHEFKFGTQAGSVDECIKLGVESPYRPVFISDSGDNPTAGGVGDVTYVLEKLISQKISDAVYASITDSEAIFECEKIGEGLDISLNIGGKLDYVHSKPLNVRGKILKIKEAPSLLSEDKNNVKQNKIVVLDVQGIKVIITKYRTPFHYISDFEQLDINPNDHKIVVVKIGYLEPELQRAAAQSFLALSPGAVNQDILALPFKRITRPKYPFDPDMSWKPQLDE
jgi:microcystin degradation protein MlrC